MFEALRNLFAKPAPRVRRHDADFGDLTWQPGAGGRPGYWDMDGHWNVPYQPEPMQCVGIAGDETGPSAQARAFLLALRDDPERLWRLSTAALREVLDGFGGLEGQDPRTACFVSSLSFDGGDRHEWEVGFETRGERRWVNACLQFEGEECVSNTIYT